MRRSDLETRWLWLVLLAIGLALLLAGCDGETATRTPTSTPTATQRALCTPPACGPDEAIVCPAECPGGCGSVCATFTPPVETDTPTPMIMCTPPACGPGEVVLCADECPGGCGSVCATVTPPVVTLTPTAVTLTPTPIIMCTPPACGPGEVIVCPDECPGGCGSVCATVTPTPASQTGADSLCQKGEEVLFSCRLPSEKAMVSVCGSRNLSANRGSVQLRWGPGPGDIQFTYPGSVRNPQGFFRFARYTRPNISYSTLSFNLGPTQYAVYDNYDNEAGQDERQAGVVIAPAAAEKVDAPCAGEVTGSLLALEPVIPNQEWQDVRPQGPVMACRDTTPTGRLYTVRAGDCLYRIGLAYDLRWPVIARANGIRWPYKVRAGQRLVIPGE